MICEVLLLTSKSRRISHSMEYDSIHMGYKARPPKKERGKEERDRKWISMYSTKYATRQAGNHRTSSDDDVNSVSHHRRVRQSTPDGLLRKRMKNKGEKSRTHPSSFFPPQLLS